jgi:hypothetical protein
MPYSGIRKKTRALLRIVPEDKNCKRTFQGKHTRCRHSRSEAWIGAACRGALWWGISAIVPGWTKRSQAVEVGWSQARTRDQTSVGLTGFVR